MDYKKVLGWVAIIGLLIFGFVTDYHPWDYIACCIAGWIAGTKLGRYMEKNF